MTLDTRTPRSPRTRRLPLIATGIAAGALLAVTAPLAASAHIHVDPVEAAAGSTSTLTFSFSHGCDGSPTTALVFDLPDGVSNATPVVQGGWTIQRELASDGTPTQITFTADAPIESGLKAAVAIDVLFSENTAHTDVAFPVTQLCETGETAWTQVAEAGDDAEPESPAPVVTVGDVAAQTGHGHADAGNEAEAGTDAEHESAATASDSADPVARWLAAGGLVAGVAALIVALARGRGRKA